MNSSKTTFKEIFHLAFALVFINGWFLTMSAQVNLASSLTACYSLNGNAIDAISSQNNGLISGATPTVNRFNQASQAMYFNGSTDFIELPDDPQLKPVSDISFSCWIKGESKTDFYILFTKNNQSSWFEAYELCVDGSLTFMTRKAGASGWNQVNSVTQYSPATWYHLVTTINNFSVCIYVNGVLEGTTSVTFAGFEYMQNKKVIIGRTLESGYDKPFKGTIDNMRFYNRVISAAEVQALYSSDPPCGGALAINQYHILNEVKVNPIGAGNKYELTKLPGQPVFLSVSAMNGHIVFKKHLEDERVFDLCDLNPGVYVLSLECNAGVFRKKITVP